MIVYKYLSPDRSDVLVDSRIRFTQPAVLNDPFETLPVFTEYRNTLKKVIPEFSQLQKESFNALGLSEEDVRNIALSNVLDIGLWTNLKQKMDERAIRGEKISDMRNRSTDDLGVRK
jgi:hypothetical protein